MHLPWIHRATSLFMATCIVFVNSTLAAPPDLKVNGTHLQTVENGCIVRLIGVNICGAEWSANSYGPPGGLGGNMVLSVNSAVVTWKSNCMRIPLNQDFWFGYSDGSSKSSSAQNTSYQNKYRTFIDDVVSAASSQNAYVELDLHWSGSGSWGSSVSAKQQNMPDDHGTDFWKDVATRYKNNPAVLFNLYNEPKDDSWSIWKNGGQSGSGFHTPGFQSLVNTVRTAGANNVIVVGGLAWAYDMTGIAANALTDPSGHGIAYEAHIYDNKGTGEPGIWNTNVTVAVKAGYCVIIGEFGPNTDGSQDNSGCTPFESDLIKWIDGANTSNYAYSAMGWSFNTDASPKLIANWNFGATTCHGGQVKAWLASVKPQNCTGVSMQPNVPVSGGMPDLNKNNFQRYTITGKAVGNSRGASRIRNGAYLCRNGKSIFKTIVIK
jgi:endoglucanase